jgi:hypothetical protein
MRTSPRLARVVKSAPLCLLLIAACPAGIAVAADVPKDLQPWNGAALSDWANAKKPAVITDMTKAEPPTAFSPLKPKKGHWMTIPYEMRPDSGGHKGTAIWCGYESDPPEVKIRLGVKGWHAIFIGSVALTGSWVKLDTDKAPRWVSNGIRDYYVNSGETFFKAAELTEQSTLVLGPRRHGIQRAAAGITHITLVPLTGAEIERLKRERADTSHRTMVATHDGFSHICGISPRTAEELLTEVEIYRHSDFGTFILHGAWGGDKTIYPSEIGHMPGGELEDVCQHYHRDFLESVQAFARQKINPLKILIDGAHDVGMKVHVGMRPGGWSYYQPFNGLWETPFFQNNPQWRCVDRVDLGAPEVTRMSWAVPEVRAHIIALLLEQVGFGADGAHMVFNRGYPVTLYEKPFCDLFKNKHGMDPNDLKDDDPRIVQVRADVVSTFFKELRAKLDEEARRRGNGKRLEISVSVLGSHANNAQYGVDVGRLVKEKLLDAVYVYPNGFGATKKPVFAAEDFREACGSEGVPWLPSLTPPYDLKGKFFQALKLYETDAAGLMVWDASAGDPFSWGLQSRFGHISETRWRSENLTLEKLPRQLHFFKWWGEQRMDVRYPPYWGG